MWTFPLRMAAGSVRNRYGRVRYAGIVEPGRALRSDSPTRAHANTSLPNEGPSTKCSGLDVSHASRAAITRSRSATVRWPQSVSR